MNTTTQNASQELLEQVIANSVCAKLHMWRPLPSYAREYTSIYGSSFPIKVCLPLPEKSVLLGGESVLARYLANVLDDLCINGGPKDWETGYPKKDEPYPWKGYRCIAHESGDLLINCSAFSVPILAFILQSVGCRPFTGQDWAWLVPPKVEAKMISLMPPINIVSPNSPYIIQLFGYPLWVSEQIPINLNVNAVYDGQTTTKTLMLIVKRSSFEFVYNYDCPIEINSENIILNMDFSYLFAGTYDTPSVGMGYNIC